MSITSYSYNFFFFVMRTFWIYSSNSLKTHHTTVLTITIAITLYVISSVLHLFHNRRFVSFDCLYAVPPSSAPHLW